MVIAKNIMIDEDSLELVSMAAEDCGISRELMLRRIIQAWAVVYQENLKMYSSFLTEVERSLL